MTTVLDVTIPVYNEEANLAGAVHRLRDHLTQTMPYPFRITIADNASTDGTWEVATYLAATVPGVAAVHLDAKGRGRALKQVWLASDALVLAYMDVDLSTDLDALWPLVAPLMSGHSDLAIGSRLAHGARVLRGAKREFISRSYNLLLRRTLGVHFRDAQCGFKAIRADVAPELLPLVEDPAWFFDTELLALAERCDLRIHEVPVDWCDDPDSRVDIVSTALEDLRGVRRLRRAFARGTLPTADIAARIGRRMPTTPAESEESEAGGGGSGGGGIPAGMPAAHGALAGVAGRGRLGREALLFALVGLGTTVVHLGLFALLRQAWSAQLANVVALGLATIVNTSANRRWTFGVRERAGAARHQVQGFAVFFLTWAMTSGALALLHGLTLHPPTLVETGVVAVATAVSTAVKFVLMKTWMFGASSDRDTRIERSSPADHDRRLLVHG